MSKLTVDLKIGETVTIGGATVRLEKKSGQLARLVIVADDHTPIHTPKSARMSASLQGDATHGQHSVRQGSPALS